MRCLSSSRLFFLLLRFFLLCLEPRADPALDLAAGARFLVALCLLAALGFLAAEAFLAAGFFLALAGRFTAACFLAVGRFPTFFFGRDVFAAAAFFAAAGLADGRSTDGRLRAPGREMSDAPDLADSCPRSLSDCEFFFFTGSFVFPFGERLSEILLRASAFLRLLGFQLPSALRLNSMNFYLIRICFGSTNVDMLQ